MASLKEQRAAQADAAKDALMELRTARNTQSEQAATIAGLRGVIASRESDLRTARSECETLRRIVESREEALRGEALELEQERERTANLQAERCAMAAYRRSCSCIATVDGALVCALALEGITVNGGGARARGCAAPCKR